MPEGKKAAVPAPKPVREEDLYSAKTHLHQPVQVQETATVSATAQLADAPEGALPSEVRPEIVTWEKLCEACLLYTSHLPGPEHRQRRG